MKSIYLVGVLLTNPVFAFADAGHTVASWYHDTLTLISLIVATIAIGALAYGLSTKQKIFAVIPSLVLAVALVTGISSYNQVTNESQPMLAVADFGAGQSITLYKSQPPLALVVIHS